MRDDIINLIKTFDYYLDNMYDRGSFDPTDENDAKIEKFLKEMKERYY